MARYIGIDFSGGVAPWRVRVSRPTVWVATLEGSDGRLFDHRRGLLLCRGLGLRLDLNRLGGAKSTE
jgi:hypothetical protein